MVGQIFVDDESSDHCHNGRAKRYFSQVLGVLFQPRSHLSQNMVISDLQVSTRSVLAPCSTCLSFLLSSTLKQRRYCNLYVQKLCLELYSTV
jgi:hypothetical protein